MKKKILLALAFFLIAIQFIRPEKNTGSASTAHDISHYVEVPGHIQNILQASCYDCHSNHTNYPWYTNINPIGLWLNHHVEEGKAELNFSDFSGYDLKKIDHKLEETAEEVQEGHMPLPAYLWMHDKAKLSQEQISQVVNWVKTARKELAAAK